MSEENTPDSGESGSSEEKEEGQVNGNEYGMLISSMGSKWECFGGDVTGVTVGLSSEFLTGLEYSSKLGGILEYSAGASVGYTGNKKYEFIDTQGFMFDNEGLQYFGETQNITTESSFFQTAGFNAAGITAYEACESFVNTMSWILMAIHGVISAGGFATAITNQEGAIPDTQNKAILAVNNIPMMISVIGVLATLYEAYTEAFKLFIQGLTGNAMVQPTSIVYGSKEKLFTGSGTTVGYSQVLQQNGVVTIGAAPSVGGVLIPAKIPLGGIEVDYQYATPPESATITVNGPAQSILTKSLQNVTTESPIILSTATTSFTTACGASKVEVTDGVVQITVGTTIFQISSAQVAANIGAAKFTMTDGSLNFQAGTTSFVIDGGGLILSGPKIEIEGTLNANGVNLSVVPS